MNAQIQIEAATLASAMARAFAEIEGATKAAAGQVGQQRYKYADLTSVIDAIKPALVNNGLFFTQHPEPSERGVCIETVLHHAGGESLPLGKLFVPANKQDAQAYGSALTYARRYALVTAFGVPVEDDDGNAASKSSQHAQGHSQTGAVSPEPAISDEQFAKLQQLIPAAKVTPAQFCQRYRCKTVRELLASQFDEAEASLNERLADLAKQATDKEAAHA